METLIKDNLEKVRQRMVIAVNERRHQNQVFNTVEPRLVVVSKLQPKEAIIEAYKCGQRCFGENYIQELFDKSNDKDICQICPEIQWHLIGHIQTNKVNKLLGVKNLSVIETIDSVKLAQILNKSLEKSELRVRALLQINVNDDQSENNKSGVRVEEALSLYTFVRNECPNIELTGLMTIGEPNTDQFETLFRCGQDICESLDMPLASMEFSMGMSADFEEAILMGSTSVRVGTAIFGQRSHK